MANVGPNVWYGSWAAALAVAGWTAGMSAPAGKLVRQSGYGTTVAAGNERVFVATTGGTTNASTEPTWILTKGARSPASGSDGSVVWFECTGQPGVNGDIASSPTWLQNKNTAVTLGLIIYDSVSGSLQIVTAQGTTGNGAQPTFSATAGVTTTDGGVTWTSLGAATNFGNWAAPFARAGIAGGTNWTANGSNLYLADNHLETQASANSTTFVGGVQVISYDHTLSLAGGPTPAGMKAGATIQTTGAFALTFQFTANSWGYAWGLTLQCGSGATNVALSLTGNPIKMENCQLQKLGTTGNTQGMVFTSVDLVNCTTKFGSTGDAIRPAGYIVRWRNDIGVPAIDTSGQIPTGLINTQGGIIELRDLDLSPILSGSSLFVTGGTASVINCKITAGVIPGFPTFRNPVFNDFIFTDSVGSTHAQQRSGYFGTLVSNSNVYRVGGASNGVVNYSWQLGSLNFPIFQVPFECFPIGRWNAVVGANLTATIYGMVNAAALPTNDQVWMDIEYLGSSAAPIATRLTLTKPSVISVGTPLPADTVSQWQAPNRQNSTPYSVGNAIDVPSNPGRVFFCISGSGNTAASEPAGYATAVDGGTVTDGGYTFRAGMRFSLSLTMSSPQPQLQGDVTAQVYLAGPANNTTYFIDPYLNLA